MGGSDSGTDSRSAANPPAATKTSELEHQLLSYHKSLSPGDATAATMLNEERTKSKDVISLAVCMMWKDVNVMVSCHWTFEAL